MAAFKRIVVDGYARSDAAAMRKIDRNRQLVRLNQDMTQQAPAVQTGLSRLAIDSVENGRGGPTCRKYRKGRPPLAPCKRRGSRRNDDSPTTAP